MRCEILRRCKNVATKEEEKKTWNNERPLRIYPMLQYKNQSERHQKQSEKKKSLRFDDDAISCHQPMRRLMKQMMNL